MEKTRIVFCGTPDFSVDTLEALHKNPDIEIVSVITMPDRPSGRGQKLHSPPVATFAKDHNLPLFQTENINREDEFLNQLLGKNVDIFIVIAFSQFLSKKVLGIPKYGCFNIHGSLLPHYRGAAPIQYSILNGDKSTAVTIQKMVSKMDAGDIVFTQKMDIDDNETGGELFDRMKTVAASSCTDFIQLFRKDQLTYEKQDETQATYAPTISKQDGRLDFSAKTNVQILNKVRAFYPWPGTYFFLNGKRVKVHKVNLETLSLKPNEINTQFKTLVIGCKEGSLRLSHVQLEGKKMTTDTEMLNGLSNKIDKFLITEN